MKTMLAILSLAASLAAQELEGPHTYNSPALLAGTPITIPFTANSAGATAKLLVIGVVNGSTTEVKKAAVSDVGVIGIAMTTATSGAVQIATRGQVTCTFENTAVANELVVVGTGTAGDCRSSGQTASTAISNVVQIIGRVIDGGAAGDHTIQIFGPGHYGTSVGVDTGGTGQTSYTKGDLLCATGSTALTKLAVGSNTQVLTADSTQTCGVKWAAAAGGGSNTYLDYLDTQTAVSGNQTLYQYSLAGGSLGTAGCVRQDVQLYTTSVGANAVFSFFYGSTFMDFAVPVATHVLTMTFKLCANGSTTAQVLTSNGITDHVHTSSATTILGFDVGPLGTATENSASTLSLGFAVRGVTGGTQTTQLGYGRTY